MTAGERAGKPLYSLPAVREANGLVLNPCEEVANYLFLNLPLSYVVRE